MSQSELPGTEQERKDLLEQVRAALNPNNDGQINDYIDSTVGYISSSMQKMSDTDDKDKTAQEIANDLTSKFESWAKDRQAQDQQSADTKQDSQ